MKNSNTVAALLFSALAAAAPLQQRAYEHKTNKVVYVTTTSVTTHWLEYGETAPAVPAPSAVDNVQAEQHGRPQNPKTSSVAAVPTSSYAAVPVVPGVSSVVVAPTSVYTPPAAPTPAVPTPAVPDTPAVTSSAAVVQPPPAASSAAVVQPPPAASSAAAAPAPSGGAGSGGANPYFPNGPKVGESHKSVRLSPLSLYGSVPGTVGLDHHVGACGKYPYDQNDPQLAMTDSAGDNKVMLNPPNGDIMSYCGAIIKVTGPDGRTTTGTVTDSCADCGGPGGMDLMAAGWAEVGQKDDSPVPGASWELTGWLNIAPYKN